MKQFISLILIVLCSFSLSAQNQSKRTINSKVASEFVKDNQGNSYKTVKIGNQVWMAENLRTTRYNDGQKIPEITNHIEWFNAKGPGYCWYNNDSAANAKMYGGLYNWEVINAGDLCPDGWRVATKEDWQEFVDFQGGAIQAANKLKMEGNDFWYKPNSGATNESRFSAMPGGFRYVDGSYVTKGYIGFWWTASGLSNKKAYVGIMRHDSSEFFFVEDRTGQGFSIRCIKEDTTELENVNVKTTAREGLLRVKPVHPENWEKLVQGGKFIDRLLPMPEGKTSDNTWGVEGIQKRYIDNGIEHPDYSFWGGNILKGDDGKYHFFVCGWSEKLRMGHGSWPHSKIYHTTSDSLIGPYTIQDTIGPGGNPEAYRMNDGRYAIYSFFGSHANRTFNLYIADSPDGPWEKVPFECDYRDREAIFITNFAFAKRPDGSFIGVSKKGEIWISKTGATPYNLVLEKSVYPDIEGIFEDPVFWRDNVQYNMIMHDWAGHVAYYARSKDGINWVTDPGEAYELGCAKHADGYIEDWVTFERIKIFQDEHGRAIQANFAVIDTLKTFDKGNDIHNSKNISVPINPGLLLLWEGKETDFPSSEFNPVIRIKAEKYFNPVTNLDLSSLRFGASTEVNYGRGSKVISSKKDGNDLVLTFDSNAHFITEKEFAPKLLGKDKKGKMVFGYSRLPWVEYEIPILSARVPEFESTYNGNQVVVEVENFGIVDSEQSQLILKIEDQVVKKKRIPVIHPYEKVLVKLNIPVPKGARTVVIEIKDRKHNISTFRTKLGM